LPARAHRQGHRARHACKPEKRQNVQAHVGLSLCCGAESS
jgi:hypothetical protein